MKDSTKILIGVGIFGLLMWGGVSLGQNDGSGPAKFDRGWSSLTSPASEISKGTQSHLDSVKLTDRVKPTDSVLPAKPEPLEQANRSPARDWKSFRSGEIGWHVVVPKSYGADQAKYLPIIAELCEEGKRCNIRFWHSENDIQEPSSLEDDEAYDRRVGDYWQYPGASGVKGVSFGCPVRPEECSWYQLPVATQQPQGDWKVVRQNQEKDDHYIVVPASYGPDRERYSAVATRLCPPQKLCSVAFWFDETKVPATKWGDEWTDDVANAEVAHYLFLQPNDELNGVMLACWLDPRPLCIHRQQDGVRVD